MTALLLVMMAQTFGSDIVNVGTVEYAPTDSITFDADVITLESDDDDEIVLSVGGEPAGLQIEKGSAICFEGDCIKSWGELRRGATRYSERLISQVVDGAVAIIMTWILCMSILLVAAVIAIGGKK